MNFKKMLRSFGFAYSGLKTVVINDNNFKFQLIAAIIIIFCGFYYYFNYLEWAIVVLCILLVLALELLNSSIERVMDKFAPEYDPKTKEIKDISAAAVLVASIGAGIVGIILIAQHIKW